MEYLKDGKDYIVRLEKDELIMESLKKMMLTEKIPSAYLVGLGALKKSELGFYHLDKKEYSKKVFENEMELVSLVGNMSWHKEEPIVHIHVGLGDEDFHLYGGHLFDAVVAVTVEIRVQVYTTKIERHFHEDIGLNLMRCRI